MISFAEALEEQKKLIGEKLPKSERSDILKQLYGFYEEDYKKEKWKDYIRWLKANNRPHTSEAISAYKKSSYPQITVKSFCSFWLSHIPTNDLYFLLSIARDKRNRGESFNRWLFHSLKVQKEG